MLKRTINVFITASLLLASACGPLQAPTNLGLSSNVGSMTLNSATLFAKRKISPVYNGPLTVTVDPNLSGKRSGFSTKAGSGGFRITAQSLNAGDDHDSGLGNSGGTDSDNPGHNGGGDQGLHLGQSRRRVAWLIEHGSQVQHSRDDQSAYFDPRNPTQFGDTHIDPKLGEETIDDRSFATVSLGGPEPANFVSGMITVYPKSEAGLQQILQLVGGQVVERFDDTFVKIKVDVAKADLSSLPDYLRQFAQYLPEPITTATFASVDVSRTFTLALMLATQYPDLFYTVSLDCFAPLAFASGHQAPDTDSFGRSTERTGYPSSANDYIHLVNHRVREAWQLSGLGLGVKVAYIDQGFEDFSKHRELERITSVGEARSFGGTSPFGMNLYRDDATNAVILSDKWHGTETCEVGFADINNHAGTIGVAPNVTLVPLRVQTIEDIGRAIDYAIDRNVDVIGTSIYAPSYLPNTLANCIDIFWFTAPTLTNAIRRAANANVPFVMAAGNVGRNMDQQLFGCFSEPIVVGAVEPRAGGSLPGNDWVNTGYSNHGSRIDVWATGTVRVDGWSIVRAVPYNSPYFTDSEYFHNNYDLPGTSDWNRTVDVNGTSFSAPQVCATVALMKSVAKRDGYNLTVSKIREILRGSPQRADINSSRVTVPVSLPSSGWSDPSAPVLDAEDAVKKTIQAARTNTDLNTLLNSHRYMTQFGLMTNVRPLQNGETADFVLNGNAFMPGGLLQSANTAYSLQASSGEPYSRAGHTYLEVEGWPQLGGFEVYNLKARSIPNPVVNYFAPVSVDAGAAPTFQVNGQYLIPPLNLLISGLPNVPASSASLSLDRAEFPASSPLSAGNYAMSLQSAGVKTVSLPALHVNAPPPPPGGGSSGWTIHFFNVDDYSYAYLFVNGLLLDAHFGEDKTYSLDSVLQPGSNPMELKCVNFGSGYNWGFEIKHNGVTVYYNKSNGTVGVSGANGNDQAVGNVFSDVFNITV